MSEAHGSFVLDTSTVLALLNNKDGAAMVEPATLVHKNPEFAAPPERIAMMALPYKR